MKRKSLNNMAFLFITVLIILSSCQKENKELTVEFETVEFSENPAESKIISIYSDTKWVVEIQQAGTWLSVTPTSGRNDDILTLTAQVNDDFAERYATITVSGLGVKDKSIDVMQQGDKTKDVILLKEVHYNSYWLYTYEYDEQHRLTNRNQYDSNDSLRSMMTLTYDDDGDLISVDWVDVNGYTILSGPTKNGNKISFRGVGMSSYEVELNTEGLPEKATHGWTSQSTNGWRRATYTYTWVNRNLAQADYNVIGVSSHGEEYENSGTKTYTYDDMKSPFYHCATPRWFWLWYYFDTVTACSLNNLIPADSGDETFNYTYNEDGFLATEKRDGANITYIYKRRAGTGNNE